MPTLITANMYSSTKQYCTIRLITINKLFALLNLRIIQRLIYISVNTNIYSIFQ